MMVWKCFIPGKTGTDWDGGFYPLTMEFPPEYPAKPPKACSLSPPSQKLSCSLAFISPKRLGPGRLSCVVHEARYVCRHALCHVCSAPAHRLVAQSPQTARVVQSILPSLLPGASSDIAQLSLLPPVPDVCVLLTAVQVPSSILPSQHM